MKFSIEVGETEKHRVACETKPLLGLFTIKVDDVERTKVRHLFSSQSRAHRFDIGKHERIHVTVEKVGGLFSGETIRVFVNGRLLRCYSDAKSATVEASAQVAAA